MSILSARAAVISGACLLGGLPFGCKRKPAPDPAPAGSASAAARASALPSAGAALPVPDQPSRCRRLPGPALLLEPEAPAPARAPLAPGDPSPDDEDDDARLPFGVDTGAVVTLPGGFAVSGIRGAGSAFVAVLGERASRRVDLGELHGDVEPPALAAAGERVIVALRSSDAAGFTVKLGHVTIAAGGVEWGQELSKLGKLVSSVDVVVSGPQGALVLQSEDKQRASRVLLGTFSPQDLHQPLTLTALEAKDVELPRLSARPGGFWLTWVRSLPEVKQAPKPKPDAGEDPEERELLEQGLRVVEVAKLDERGQLQGAALRLGQPRRQVVLFDVGPLASGGLLVAMRSDTAAPGVEGGALLLSEVLPDGSVRQEPLEDDEIGAGAPVLLADLAGAPPELWLSVSSPRDAPRLGPVRGARTFLQADPLLGRSEVIGVGGGRFLTQRARGRGLELGALACQLLAEAPAEQK